MDRRVRPAAVNTKLIVILVILVVIAAVIWIVRLSGGSEEVPGLSEGPFVLWCPECDEEFTFATREEARDLTQEVDGELRTQCPKCKKFAAVWGGRRPAEPERQGDVQATRP